MIYYDLGKPINIHSDPRVRITIEYEGELVETKGVNIFGGFIPEYSRESPVTCVVPIVAGSLTPGMILSYVSGLLTSAMEILKDDGVPKELVREIAIIAIDEGLSSKIIHNKKTRTD